MPSASAKRSAPVAPRGFQRRLIELLSCQRSILQAVTPGGSAGVDAPVQSPECTASDSRIASGEAGVNRLLSLCCRFDVGLLSFRQHFLGGYKRGKLFVFQDSGGTRSHPLRTTLTSQVCSQ